MRVFSKIPSTNMTAADPLVELKWISIFPDLAVFLAGAGVGQEVQFEASGMYHSSTVVSKGSNEIEEKNISPLVTWSSADETIATIDAAGVFKAVSPGDTTIVGSCCGEEASYFVSVIPPYVTTLSLTPEEKTIQPSDRFTFAAKGLKTDGTTTTVDADKCRWSLDSDVTASINNDGIVEGVEPGTVTITAQWNNEIFDTLTAEATVIVR